MGTGIRSDGLYCQGFGTSDAVTAVNVSYDGKGEGGCLHEGGRIYLQGDCRTLQHYHAGSFRKADKDEKKIPGIGVDLDGIVRDRGKRMRYQANELCYEQVTV